jgi:hypothetical protein
MTDPAYDPIRIVASLEVHGVEYVLVGGLAAAAHGSPLDTDDVDVILPPDPDNLDRLGLVLLELDAEPIATPDDHRVSYRTSAGRLDLIEMGSRYFEVNGHASTVDVGRGISAKIASAEDLAELKRASGDLATAAHLSSLAEDGSDDDDPEMGDAAELGSSGRKMGKKIWNALESVDTFLTDLDSRGLRIQRKKA